MPVRATSPSPAARHVISAPARFYPNLARCVAEVSHEKPTSSAEMLRGRNSVFFFSALPPPFFSFWILYKEPARSAHSTFADIETRILEFNNYTDRALTTRSEVLRTYHKFTLNVSGSNCDGVDVETTLLNTTVENPNPEPTTP